MKLEHLRSLEALRIYRNFSKAAEHLYMSQPTLSKQLRALENELGVALFERSHSAVCLTPVGERIFTYVKTILDAYDALVREVKDYTETDNRKLRVASFYDMAQYGITDLFVSFERNRVGFHIESKECDHATMLKLLDNRKVDMIIGYREFWPERVNYDAAFLRKDDLVLVTHITHRLAGESSILLTDLRHERFCFPREDGALFKFFYDICVSAGFCPWLTLSDVRLATIKQYIRAGMRVTLQTRVRATNVFCEPEFRLVGIRETPLLNLAILTNRTLLSQTGWEFIRHACEVCSNVATSANQARNTG